MSNLLRTPRERPASMLTSTVTPRFPRDAWTLYFGAVLGAGFLTRIPYFGYFVLVAGCFGRGNLWAGAFVMTVFGAARAVSVVVAAMWAPRLPIRPGRPREYYVVGSLQSMVKATHSWQAGSLFFVSSVILWFALSKG